MPLRGSIHFFPGCSDAAGLVSLALRETFEQLDLAVLSEDGEPSATTPGLSAVDSYFALALAGDEDFTIVIASCRLETVFGYRIAAETRGQTVVAAGPSIKDDNVTRIIRHELGHVFGLNEHLDCAMSRYYVEDSRYCSVCSHALVSRGIHLTTAAVATQTIVGSQNRIRRKLQRYVMVNCRGVPSRRGIGQAMPPESSRKRCGGTACHVLFEGTFLAMRSVIQSERRSLRSGHRSPMTQAETAHASYAASRQE